MDMGIAKNTTITVDGKTVLLTEAMGAKYKMNLDKDQMSKNVKEDSLRR